MQAEGAAQKIRGLACDLCPGIRGNRRAKKGAPQEAFVRLQHLGIIQIQVNAVSLNSACIKAHPDGMAPLKKRPQSAGRTRGGWNTKLPMAAASDRDGVMFALSAGNYDDVPDKSGRHPGENPNRLEPHPGTGAGR